MPSLNISSPSAPTLLTGLSPVAASPIAPIDAMPGGAFSTVIAGLGQGMMLDAPPAPNPGVGTALPPDRPVIAGDTPVLPPQPLQDIDIAAVMVGSGAVPPLPQPPVADPAPPPAPSPSQTETKSDAPPVEDGLVTCGLQITLDGKFGLPRMVFRKLPGPIQLPPEEVPDMPATDAEPTAPRLKAAFEESKPAILVETPPPAPQPIAFAPAGETPPPPPPSNGDVAPASSGDARTSGAATAPQQQPALKTNPEPQQLPPTPVTQAQAPAQLPHSFSLPPEVARQVAQFVQAAVNETSERARDAAPALDATALIDAAAPLPQPTLQAPAPLHASFVPAHRPAIDTGRAEWMQSMIERIAEMPQTDDRREAQIRLLPSALGPVSVKVEQRDERVHVTLHAENAQTRQLLTDAAPRLQEIAEARGIRLTQGAVGGGESHDRRHSPEHQPSTPLRPRPAKADAAPESETDGDLIA